MRRTLGPWNELQTCRLHEAAEVVERIGEVELGLGAERGGRRDSSRGDPVLGGLVAAENEEELGIGDLERIEDPVEGLQAGRGETFLVAGQLGLAHTGEPGQVGALEPTRGAKVRQGLRETFEALHRVVPRCPGGDARARRAAGPLD